MSGCTAATRQLLQAEREPQAERQRACWQQHQRCAAGRTGVLAAQLERSRPSRPPRRHWALAVPLWLLLGVAWVYWAYEGWVEKGAVLLGTGLQGPD